MRIQLLLGASALLVMVVSCGVNSAPSPYGPPTTTIPNPNVNPGKPEELRVGARMKVGAVERYFYPQTSTSCMIDSNQGESVVTFSDTQNGATLSVRMINFNPASKLYETANGNTQETVVVALGGETKRNTFRYDSVARSHCRINYTLSKTHMTANMQCENLINRDGQTTNAEAQWICSVQSSNDWNW